MKPVRKDLAIQTHLSKYARYLPEVRRRETIQESNARVMDMHRRKYPDLPESLMSDIQSALDSDLILGSMRSQQFGGVAIERENSRLYNCSASYFDRVRFLQEAVWLLLCGCGVGFSVQKHHVAKLPRLYAPVGDFDKWVVDDSIAGWADAFGALFESYVDPESGTPVRFDYSQVRPEGSPISTSSAKAPGPKALRDSLEACRTLLDRVVAEQNGVIRPIDAYDLVMHAAMCIRAGGIRRSATIALFSADDEEMANAKTGNWFEENPQRRLSNNSALLVRSEVTREQFNALIESTRQFGEPGFYFADSTEEVPNPCLSPDTRLATDKGWCKVIDLANDDSTQTVVVTDTRVAKDSVDMTNRGSTQRLASKVKLTQKSAQLFELETTHGHIIKATANHIFPTTSGRKRLDELVIGDELLLLSGQAGFGDALNRDDGFALGLLAGDGCICQDEAFIDLWEQDFSLKERVREIVAHRASLMPSANGRKYDDLTLLDQPESINKVKKVRVGGMRFKRWVDSVVGDSRDLKQGVPDAIFKASREGVTGYLQGLFATDGSVQLSGSKEGLTASLRLTSVKPELLRGVQTLLSGFGVVSRIYLRRQAGMTLLPDGRGGSKEYPTQDCFELIISRPDMVTFEREVGLVGPKAEKLKAVLDTRGRDCRKPQKFITEVRSVKACGVSDVYCLTEPETNSIVVNGVSTGQCVEIGMFPHDEITQESGFSFCNVSSVNAAKCKDETDFLKACDLAAALGTLQAGYQTFSYLTQASNNINRRDALLGVSLTGLADSPWVMDEAVLAKGREVVRQTNARIAPLIGVNAAARLTCVKPEGTGSLRVQAGNGIHPHHSRRYLRLVEGGKTTDAVTAFMLKHVPEAVLPSAYNSAEVKLAFPIDLGEGELWLKADTTAEYHLGLVKMVQENWVAPGTNRGTIRHNVSNTVQVGPDEWNVVADTIWNNRHVYAGVSLMGSYGDLDYPQAPFTEVLTEDEIQAKYGDRPEYAEKARAVAELYDRVLQSWPKDGIPWEELSESEDATAGLEIVACAGGACAT